MKFGVFDQNDWSGRPSVEQYAERLALGALYEEHGFYCYHMSEHHGTPLSITPSPSVFLAALSQRTTTLRFGPLVFLLPGYSPLRLAEEIAMLDNLSGGRFEFGVGKGASPHEMGYLGVAPDQMQPMYVEATNIILSGLSQGVLDHQGKYWSYDKVKLSIRPVQTPRPPLWVALGSPESAVWAARNAASVVVMAPAERARMIFRTYLDEFSAAVPPHNAEPLLGINRYIVVAPTEEEAFARANRAWDVFYSRFIELWNRHGGTPSIGLRRAFADVHASGSAIVGTPERVLAELGAQITTSGANFLSGTFTFGDMTDEEARSSIGMFAREVMPALAEIGMSAHARLRSAA